MVKESLHSLRTHRRWSEFVEEGRLTWVGGWFGRFVVGCGFGLGCIGGDDNGPQCAS